MSAIEKIALIGMGIRFPGADTPARFWEHLLAGRCLVKRFSREELLAAGIEQKIVDDPAYVPVKGVLEGIDKFDRAFFGYSPGEAATIDPQQRIFLETAWEALESAGYDPYRFAGRIGLFAGSGMNTYLSRQLAAAVDLNDTATLYQAMIGNDKDFLATRVAYLLNLRGPALAVQCACSTSLVAIHLACQSLLSHECDMAMAGGVTIRIPVEEGYLWNDGMILAPDGVCRPFDAAAAGTVPGSGAGVVLLKRYDEALADGDPIRCVILGSAINNDGASKVGYSAPSVAGQVEVIAEAHGVAETDPRTIGFVECHGTGTPMGDPIEIAALTEAFAIEHGLRGQCAVGAVKANIGHCDTAAGVAGFIKAALVVEQGLIPPLANFSGPNPEIDFAATPFFVPTAAVPWPLAGPRRAGVSAFGIGGTNAHVVLEQAPAGNERPCRPGKGGNGQPERSPGNLIRTGSEAPVAAERAHLLLLSAKDERALTSQSARLADALADDPRLEVGDVGFTLASGRARFDRRRALAVTSRVEAMALLRHACASPAVEPVRLVFLFPGQGSQYPGMGRDVGEMEPAYRRAFDEVAALFTQQGIDIGHLLAGTPEELLHTRAAQPALFAVEYALAALWLSWGARPDAMIGHSIGELVAATVAGVMTLPDAVRLVAERATLMQSAPAGGMLALGIDEGGARELAGAADLDVAVVNGPKAVVVSGSEAGLLEVERMAGAAGVPAKRLKTAQAFHSRAMAGPAGRLADVAGKIRFNAPAIPYISNLTGTFVTTVDADYWGAHVRGTVRFAGGIATLAAAGPTIFVELGPGSTLTKLVPASAGPGHHCVSTLPDANAVGSAHKTVLAAFGACWAAGADLDPSVLYQEEKWHRVVLPTYPFQRVRCWAEGRSPAPLPKAGGRRPVAEWFMARGWRQVVSGDASGFPHGPWLIAGKPEGLENAARWLQDQRQEMTTGADPATILLVDPDFSTMRSAVSRIPDGDRSLVAILRNGAALFATDRLDPDAAMVVAALRVVSQERPGWKVRVLDVGEAFPAAPQFAIAARMAAEPDGPFFVAWRGGCLWEEEFRPLPIRREPRTVVEDGHVWLITGGPGGVASVLAESLAEQAKVKIAFVTRSGRRHGIEPLLSLGAAVACYAADVADQASLTAVWRRIETDLGPIHGVIHAAGVTGPQSFALLEEAADGVPHFAAKIEGTKHIAALAGGVERVILVSSTAAVLGGVGRMAYAAANAWMDACAATPHDGRWTSVGWDAWAIHPTGVAWNSLAIDIKGGKEAFATILAGPYHPHVVVTPAGLDHRESFARAIPTTPSDHPQPSERSPLADKIARAWATVLGLQNVGSTDDFFRLGGDSLMATRALSRMKSDFGIEASMALFFEAPTPAGLASALETAGSPEASREKVTL
jgi:phthiocerol/phenolphthiocerol synthesis type-I polyketide synthase E